MQKLDSQALKAMIAQERALPTPLRHPTPRERIQRAHERTILEDGRLWPPFPLGKLLAIKGDQPFLSAVYRSVLNRDADPVGLAHYQQALASHALTRAEVISRIRSSREGIDIGRPLPGLRWRLIAAAPLRPLRALALRLGIITAKAPQAGQLDGQPEAQET